MPLPLPNLDDRRWVDLTQEAIPLIPRYAPQWTDFNTHDPGITLMELFAWLTESLIYQLDQVPDRFRWKFLSLIGYHAHGPQPAWTVLTFQPIPTGPAFELPAGVQFSAGPVALSTARPVNLSTVTLTALQGDPGTGTLRDYSLDLIDALPSTPWGNNPPRGAAIYLGFEAIPAGVPVALWLWFQGAGHDEAERRRIIAEAEAQKAACRIVEPGWRCNGKTAPDGDRPCPPAPAVTPPHQSATVVWETFAGGAWTALTSVAMAARPGIGEVMDNTRSLTLNGLVEINLPATIAKSALGPVATPLYYLRCRLASGAYDAPVVLSAVQPNAVAAVQQGPLWQQLAVAATLAPLSPAPTPGEQVSLQFTLAPGLSILKLAVQSPPAAGQQAFTLLNYAAPGGGDAGSLTMAFAVAGIGTAAPLQTVTVPAAPVEYECFRLYTHDGVTWTLWQRTGDFEAAKRTDLFYSLDPTAGTIRCGDGEHGQVFPQGSAIVVTGLSTLAGGGNLGADRISGVAANPVNAVLLSPISATNQALLSKVAANVVPAAGGLPVTPLDQLEGDAAEVIAAHERILDLAQNAQQSTLDQIPKSSVLALPAPSQAVTLLDTERIALDVPGTVVARAHAWADTDPAFPGIHATGVVTVVILPAMPVAQPEPSAGLLAAVKRYLDRRRIICTRMEVTAPTYLVITVTANVTATTGASTTAVQSAILAALQNFLDPLSGGPAGLGWPFGRSVYQAEILQLIANVPGVDHVNSMTITPGSGKPRCSDIPLCPVWLVSSGAHQIQVVTS